MVLALVIPGAIALADQGLQRDALWRYTDLATTYVGCGQLDQVCEVGRTALDRLPHVNSPRCLALLRRLTGELRARKANSHVREFSTELDRRLKLVA